MHRISFNPARYLRSFKLKEHGYNIYQKVVYIHGNPYGLISFALDPPYAYEMAFISLYTDPALKLINDQNDCIIVWCLYDLYTNHGVSTVNLGTSAGIKGLRFFKQKRPFFYREVYAQAIIPCPRSSP